MDSEWTCKKCGNAKVVDYDRGDCICLTCRVSMSNKPIRNHINLPTQLVSEIDRFAKARQMTKTELIRKALDLFFHIQSHKDDGYEIYFEKDKKKIQLFIGNY